MRREQQQLCLSGRLLSGYLLGIHGRVSPGAGQGQGNIEEPALEMDQDHHGVKPSNSCPERRVETFISSSTKLSYTLQHYQSGDGASNSSAEFCIEQ